MKDIIHRESVSTAADPAPDPRDAMIERLSAELARAEHINKMTQRGRRHAGEQWARAGREALAGKPQSLRNRIELQGVAISEVTKDEVDGGPLIELDDKRLESIDDALQSAREALRKFAEAADGLPDKEDWEAQNKASGVVVSFYAEDKDDISDWKTGLCVGDLRNARAALNKFPVPQVEIAKAADAKGRK